MGRFSSAFYDTGEAVEQYSLRCDAGKWKAVLDARLGHIMACLQVRSRHTSKKKLYVPKARGRILVISKDRPRQRLHGSFQNAPWIEEKDDGPEGAEDEG